MKKHELTGTFASFDGGDFLEIDGKRVEDPNNDPRIRRTPACDIFFSNGTTKGFWFDFTREPSLDDLRAGLIGQIKRAKPR